MYIVKHDSKNIDICIKKTRPHTDIADNKKPINNLVTNV